MMRRISRLFFVVLLGLAIPGRAAVLPPLETAGTLSLIDDDAIEIHYQAHDEHLVPATFIQTLTVVAIAASIPPNPLNPWLVDNALHALGIPHQDYRSCWPDDGAILLVPTAPAGAVDAALTMAGTYYDPVRQAREFETAYWQRLFTYRESVGPLISEWPGDPTLESLKETIVGSLPFPANLGSMDVYGRRGIVPLMQLRGEYVPVCILFCVWFPKCTVTFMPTSEGYGIRGIR
jgi:hypothetical protein